MVEGYDANDYFWRHINADGTPDEEMLRRMTECILEVEDAERIILFGSAARGEMDERSDIDLIVVTDQCDDTRKKMKEIHDKVLGNLPFGRRATDVVVMNTRQWNAEVDCPWMLAYGAAREGRVLYDRTKEPSTG